jgi:hypothetical protein
VRLGHVRSRLTQTGRVFAMAASEESSSYKLSIKTDCDRFCECGHAGECIEEAKTGRRVREARNSLPLMSPSLLRVIFPDCPWILTDTPEMVCEALLWAAAELTRSRASGTLRIRRGRLRRCRPAGAAPLHVQHVHVHVLLKQERCRLQDVITYRSQHVHVTSNSSFPLHIGRC